MGPEVVLSSLYILLFVLMVWEIVWKGIAMWKCGRNNQLVWFVVILILNTVGILPIVYILFFQKKASKIKRLDAKKSTRKSAKKVRKK